MTNTTLNTAAILTEKQIYDLLIEPVQKLSVFAQASTVIPTRNSAVRVPIMASGPTAAWTAEGAEIAITDADIDELVLTPAKLAGLTVISNELANDSSPAAAEMIGGYLANDLAAKLDAGAFGNLAAPAPAGLEALSGIKTVAAPNDANGFIENLDWAANALSLAEARGTQINSFVTSPETALRLAVVKQGESHLAKSPLLQPDPTLPTRRLVQGVPLLVSPHVAPNTIWAIPAARSLLVLRQDATIETDRSAFFTSDRSAVRAILRATYGWPDPASIVKITTTAP
ncbi:phage major capsid protein [Rhodococcoides fascians]|uniref:phage major capsid protein n=1 Tax=Rhodococcoides fascians TaxID=1828 RepID=UPI000B9B4517|nr:phage major capsid protein [Rhodococcus fascians]OZE85524.1 phage major capsid protein [Rhodococcus fascians]OZF12031.1 phage major capsid protein [Rhodococcus fascians]OZF14799.1 phage major capsid protein [Rhodococcus fascians]OZF61378.1 phage major capsid protein [Rhodococcus fascians]OZF64483.1 phage major capsid protein [Rhodococcus fascians]